MKKINRNDLNIDDDLLDDVNIKGKLDIEMLLFRQIERTNQASVQDEIIFAANVNILLNMIPLNKRAEILTNEGNYTSIEQRYDYKYNCGVPMGTPEHSVCGSPRVVTEEITDWHMLYRLIMEALELTNLTWKRESTVVDAGRIVNGKPSPVPTPLLIQAPPQETPKQEMQVAEPIKRIKQPKCPICGDYIKLKTGVHFKHRLIHIDCMDIAKVKWID